MKRLALITILLLIVVSHIFASESRVNVLSSSARQLIDDPFNIIFIPGYVNAEYNYLILEPRPGATAFQNTYGILKYGVSTPIEKINVGVILNYPYPELGYFGFITTGIPAGFLVAGTTSLPAFTITEYTRDRADIILGVNKILGISLLKPFVGVGYAADYSVSTTSINSNGSVTNTVTNTESISQLKVILGSVVDLSFVSIDASVKLYFPSALNSSETKDATINNYQNSRIHKTEGAFGFDITLQPKLNLGEKTYILGLGEYFNYALPSAQVTKIDANGDGTLEEDTKIINNYQVVNMNFGASYNTYVGNIILVSAGLLFSSQNSYRTIKAEGTVGNLTNTNESYIQTSSTYIPLFVSFEVPLIDWFIVRSGVTKFIYQDSFALNDGKNFNNTVATSDNSSPIASLYIGFSIKPIKDLSIDWLMNHTFINNVFVDGRLPWIISGNNFFDNVTTQFSIEYRM